MRTQSGDDAGDALLAGPLHALADGRPRAVMREPSHGRSALGPVVDDRRTTAQKERAVVSAPQVRVGSQVPPGLAHQRHPLKQLTPPPQTTKLMEKK
jgi:hypothetical protein